MSVVPQLENPPTVTTETIQIIERLTRVEEKIDNFLTSASEHTSRHSDHETRIRSLEGSSSRLLGIGAIVAFLSGITGPHVLDLLIR